MNYPLTAKKCSPLARWLPLLCLVLLTACKREAVRVYYTAKETASAEISVPDKNSGMGALPGGNPAIAAQPRLTWKTPEGWTEVPPGEMRLASFNAKGKDGQSVDVSIVPLSGMAGGDLANVNRWRFDQTGLPKVTADELKKLAQPVEVGGQPADLYEQVGKNPGSGDGLTVVGVIQHREDTAWFFKMTGDPEAVAQQKPVLIEFLKSIQFQTGTAALPTGHPPINTGGVDLPAGHPPLDNQNPPSVFPGVMTPAPTTGPISHEGQPNWQVPAGWQEVSGGEFLVAKFLINNDGAQGAVNVSSSLGEGGGLTMNVNRWRGQLGLSPLQEDELAKSTTSIDASGGKATSVEMSGTDPKTGKATRLVGVIVPQSGQTWFYKLMGDAKIVEAQKDAFTKFVQTVKY